MRAVTSRDILLLAETNLPRCCCWCGCGGRDCVVVGQTSCVNASGRCNSESGGGGGVVCDVRRCCQMLDA
eukprot:1546368-Amphidinium_carterae.1